jgi:hypothetical protein
VGRWIETQGEEKCVASVSRWKLLLYFPSPSSRSLSLLSGVYTYRYNLIMLFFSLSLSSVYKRATMALEVKCHNWKIYGDVKLKVKVVNKRNKFLV